MMHGWYWTLKLIWYKLKEYKINLTLIDELIKLFDKVTQNKFVIKIEIN